MLLRWLATALILALLLLTAALPRTAPGRRGHEAAARDDVPTALDLRGQPFPELALRTLDGTPVDWRALRGHRVLITLERSLDW